MARVEKRNSYYPLSISESRIMTRALWGGPSRSSCLPSYCFWAATLPSLFFLHTLVGTVVRHERVLVTKAFFSTTELDNLCVLGERDYCILSRSARHCYYFVLPTICTPLFRALQLQGKEVVETCLERGIRYWETALTIV